MIGSSCVTAGHDWFYAPQLTALQSLNCFFTMIGVSIVEHALRLCLEERQIRPNHPPSGSLSSCLIEVEVKVAPVFRSRRLPSKPIIPGPVDTVRHRLSGIAGFSTFAVASPQLVGILIEPVSVYSEAMATGGDQPAWRGLIMANQ